MNALGTILFGCLARGAILAAVGGAIGSLARRRSPAAGVNASLATILLLAPITLFAFSPWPAWRRVTLGTNPVAAPKNVVAEARIEAEIVPGDARLANQKPLFTFGTDRNDDANAIKADHAQTDPDRSRAERTDESRVVASTSRIITNIRSIGVAGWFGFAALGAIGIGLIRFALGLWGVRVLVSRSIPIDDRELIDEVELMRAELSCVRRIDLRETDAISTPATVGGRRPVLLLPVDWRAWTSEERKAVLAHEIAHIIRNDYLYGVLAQLCLALHFYQLPAHWLCRRLRFDQELAADLEGARLIGERTRYLKLLAGMALRDDSISLLKWPARAFLPGKGMFVRRIEMLRDSTFLQGYKPSFLARVATFAPIVAIGLFLIGVRGPEGSAVGTVQAQGAAGAAGDLSAKTLSPIDVSIVPTDAVMIFGVRPADLLASPDRAKLAAWINEMMQNIGPGKTDVKIGEIEQILVFKIPAHDNKERPNRGPIETLVEGPGTVMLRAVKPIDWERTIREFSRGQLKFEAVDFEGQKYQRSIEPFGPNTPAYFQPDDRTIVIDRESMLKKVIAAFKNPPDHKDWEEAWKSVGDRRIKMYIDQGWLRDHYPDRQLRGPVERSIAPLLELPRTAVIGIDCDKQITLDLKMMCDSEVAATKVKQTAEAVVTLARNSLDQSAESTARMPRDRARIFGILIDTAKTGLTNAKIEQKASVVVLSTNSDDVSAILPRLIEGVRSARAGARAEQGINNLKQIGLAFHNYHSVHNHFPPAVVIGPDGKTPHIWRVEILPFLEQQALYNEYQMNEPWDSEKNLKVLAKMPAVYRSPEAVLGTTPMDQFSSYFVLTGPDTIFSDNKGCGIESITDGTSNTILAVETPRRIPWTKPEDIAVVIEQNRAIKLAGFQGDEFHTLFADGSVRTIKPTIKPFVWTALITRAKGEVVDLNDLDR